MLRPRKILLDGLAARFGGTAYAVVQLARTLGRDPRSAAPLVLTREGSIIDRGLESAPEVRVLRLRAEGRVELIHRVAWEARSLRGLVCRHEVDALVTFSGMLPVSPGCPVISYLANPVPFEGPRGLGSAVRRAAITRTARLATAVYVPSRYFARLVADLPRVSVVPLGVDRAVFRPAERAGNELLCVADFYRHKRHDLLLEAYARLPEDRPPLRLLGNPDVDLDWYHSVAARATRTPGVIVDGRVSLRRLLAAYRAARVFVIASEHESFSMPLAESLCCGVPAIARDRPALRETGGSGALYLQGDDPEAWAQAMLTMLSDDNRHAALREGALRESDRFSWETLASRLLDDVAALA